MKTTIMQDRKLKNAVRKKYYIEGRSEKEIAKEFKITQKLVNELCGRSTDRNDKIEKVGISKAELAQMQEVFAGNTQAFSQKDQEILKLFLQGNSIAEIANVLNMQEKKETLMIRLAIIKLGQLYNKSK